MASYTIILRDALGNKLDEVVNFVRLEYACAENEVGEMNLTVTRCDQERYFYKDLRAEIWRTVGSKTYLEANTVWFLRKWTLATDGAGIQSWNLSFHDANYLLGAREVEYNAGSAEAKITATIDNMMKAIFRYNLGDLAGAGRDWSAYISYQAFFALAPSTTKEFARRNVLAVLQELAQESYQRGTYLVFAIQRVTDAQLEFRTFVGQLGINHNRASGQTVVVNQQRSSLVSPVLTFDYTDEITVVTAGGTGLETARQVVTVVDTPRATETIFSRRESFLNSVQSKADTTALDAEARAELQKKRPLRTLTGTIQDTDSFAYGLDYNYGDIVVAEHEGYSFDAHVNKIHVTKDKTSETIDNKITGVI